jgi:hypothetical protein
VIQFVSIIYLFQNYSNGYCHFFWEMERISTPSFYQTKRIIKLNENVREMNQWNFTDPMVVSGQVTREYEVKKENDVKCEWNIIKSREMIFVYLKSRQLSLLLSLYSYSLSPSLTLFFLLQIKKEDCLKNYQLLDVQITLL